MLRIVRWLEWQGRAVYELTRRRREKRRKIVLSWVSVGTDLDDRFLDFQERLRRGRRPRLADFADAFLVRLLQYVARHGAESGRVHVERARFGSTCLSSRFFEVGRVDGEEVYDAVIGSGIAVSDDPSPAPRSAPVSAETTADASAPFSADAGAPGSAVVAVSGLGLGRGSETLPAVVSAVDVDRARARGPDTGNVGPSPGSAGEPEAPPREGPPSVGSPPAPDDGETARVLALVGLIPDDVHGRGGVAAPAWAREVESLLADGAAPRSVFDAIKTAGTSAKPWDAFRSLREDVARRRAADDDARKARERRAAEFAKKVDELAALTPSARAGYLATLDRYQGGPELRARYLEALKARGVES